VSFVPSKAVIASTDIEVWPAPVMRDHPNEAGRVQPNARLWLVDVEIDEHCLDEPLRIGFRRDARPILGEGLDGGGEVKALEVQDVPSIRTS
jgi:hypothetical protein